jgi:hypothetical protein
MFISFYNKICYLASSLIIRKALIKMRKSFGALFEKAYFFFASLLISSVILMFLSKFHKFFYYMVKKEAFEWIRDRRSPKKLFPNP